jgi:hypothetical protein
MFIFFKIFNFEKTKKKQKGKVKPKRKRKNDNRRRKPKTSQRSLVGPAHFASLARNTVRVKL